MVAEIVVTGIDEAIRFFGNLPDRQMDHMERVMEDEAKETIKDAQADTPVASGALRDSGRYEIEREGTAIEVRMLFGGPDAPYAVFVHEDLNAHHETGHAKFLETAANNRQPITRQRMLEAIERASRR